MQLPVYVTPKASRDEVTGWRVDANGSRELAVRVTAAPEKGKATKAVRNCLAAFFSVPKSSVSCVRGESSHHKMFELPITQEDLERLL